LRALGLNLMSPDTEAMPGVVTIAMGPGQNGFEMAQEMEQAGFLVSCNSDYLRQRNWIQICLMGEYSREKLDGLLAWLARHATAGAGAAAVAGRGVAVQPMAAAGCREC
jgi:aspartate aminotransferase-like enzyme